MKSPKNCLIYLITNNANGKVYIGKLEHYKYLDTYFGDQITRAMKGSKAKPFLYNAIRKHKPENFSVKQIDQTDTHEKLCKLETKWIKEYKSNNPKYGYNLTEGGEGNPGHKVSEEARAKIGASHKGKALSEEHKQKMREAKLKNPTNYWLGKKRPNAFGGVEKMFSCKGKKVIMIDGKRKYFSKEEFEVMGSPKPNLTWVIENGKRKFVTKEEVSNEQTSSVSC